ncbi:MAG: cytochrome P450 [Hyphomicrobiaceae bacterium]
MAARASLAEQPLYPPRVTPPPKPLSLPKFVVRFISNPLLAVPEPVYHEPLFSYKARRSRICWITAPDLVKDVLLDRRETFPKTELEQRVLGPMLGKGILTSEGAEWRWQRQLAAPLFRHGEILRYVPTMVGAAQHLVEEWRSQGPGARRHIDKDMTRATFEVIANTLLTGGESAVGRIIEEKANDYLGSISWSIAYALLSLPTWLPFPGRSRMHRAERDLRAAVAEQIRARRAAPEAADDLFARLMTARHPETGEPMSETQLVDNLLTFFTAGHETTAKALTWTLYLLARSPEWAARIREEVRAVAGDGPVSEAHIERLVVVGQVIKESMRLYPPAPVLTRVAAEDTRLADVTIAAGTLIVMPIYAIHRHRRLWADPDRFDPTRFAPEREATYSRYQFMPFGAGPRICIGSAFALIEATAMLATLVRETHFEVAAGHLPMPVSRVTLRPKGGMPMRVTVAAGAG